MSTEFIQGYLDTVKEIRIIEKFLLEKKRLELNHAENRILMLLDELKIERQKKGLLEGPVDTLIEIQIYLKALEGGILDGPVDTQQEINRQLLQNRFGSIEGPVDTPDEIRKQLQQIRVNLLYGPIDTSDEITLSNARTILAKAIYNNCVAPSFEALRSQKNAPDEPTSNITRKNMP